MTPVSTQRPLPIGELLEHLRLEGFAVTPEIYNRCFRIVDAYFPNGLTNSPDQLQELKELLGPVIVRSDIEQEKFGTIFEQLMTTPDFQTGRMATIHQPDSPEKPPQRNHLLWGAILAGIALIISGILYYLSKPATVVQEPDQTTADSTQPQLPDPNCVITVTVSSIRGNTVTFLNQSPGLKRGYRYQWDFGDGTPPVSTSTNSAVTHTFSVLNSSMATTIRLQDQGCDQTVILSNIYSDTKPTAESFPLLKATPSLQTTYQLNGSYVLLAVLLGTGLVGAATYRYFFIRRKIKPSEGPPYFLTFPDQEKSIKVAESMDVWARQLNQRDEGQRRVMNISRTLLATARMGGYPSIYYQQIKLRPRYLVLIDHRSTFHQQARLYTYLGTVLTQGEVELETFFFNADPRTCWNEKYPKGIAISDLYRLHRTSYLVLLTEGIRLIDYTKGSVAPWVTNLFDGWEKRAILTPVYPENWTYIEALLTRFFIVLPATPDGQLLLREYFQVDELPTFQELRRRFQVTAGSTADRGFFGKSADKLTLSDIDSFLDNPFDNENPTETEKNRLKQWAYATAVYPTPTWEMTLAIGHAMERYYETDALVTTTHLLKLTALPWLQQSKIPENLRQELLRRFADLPPKLKTGIHEDILNLLESVKAKHGSLAEEERELHTYTVMLTDEKHRQEGLRKLEPFQKAGLITDKGIDQQVSTHSRRTTIAYFLSLAIVLVALLAIGYLTLPGNLSSKPTGLKNFLYSQTDPIGADSAVIYNNLAAALSVQTLKDTVNSRNVEILKEAIGYQSFNADQERSFQRELDSLNNVYSSASVGYSSKIKTYSTLVSQLTKFESEVYKLELAFLMASLRHRITYEAVYNLHALRYRFGATIARTSRVTTRSLSPLGEVPKIVSPLSWFSIPDMLPRDSSLVSYLKLLNQNRPIDATRQQIEALDSYGTNLRKTAIDYTEIQTRFDQEIKQAQQAAQFNRVNLLLPNTNGKNTLRVRLPRIRLTASQTDALARLDAARIKLYFSEQLKTVAVKPTTSTPTIPTTTTSKPNPKTVRKNPASKSTPSKSPVQTTPYSTPTKTGSEQPPTTPNQEAQTTPPSENAANVKQETLPTVTSRGIPGEYGVLIGEVSQSRMINKDLYLLVAVNNERYQVRIGTESNSSSYRQSTDNPIIAIAEKDAVRKIPGYLKFSSAQPGFYPLEKTSSSGALDYLRTGDSYADFKVNQGVSLPALTKFMIAFQPFNFTESDVYKAVRDFVKAVWNDLHTDDSSPDFKVNPEVTTANLLATLGSPKKSQTRIYVWGARWQPASATSPFKLKDGFYEIHYVHMNQGSYAPNENLNAPWQDGGFILDSGGLKAIAIRFSSQSTTVDANGNPVKASGR